MSSNSSSNNSFSEEPLRLDLPKIPIFSNRKNLNNEKISIDINSKNIQENTVKKRRATDFGFRVNSFGNKRLNTNTNFSPRKSILQNKYESLESNIQYIKNLTSKINQQKYYKVAKLILEDEKGKFQDIIDNSSDEGENFRSNKNPEIEQNENYEKVQIQILDTSDSESDMELKYLKLHNIKDNENIKKYSELFYTEMKNPFEIIQIYSDQYPLLEFRKLILFSRQTIAWLSYKIIKHWFFEFATLLIIITNTIFLAFEDPLEKNPPSYKDDLELTFLILYTMEMALKIFGMGCFFLFLNFKALLYLQILI